MAIADIAKEIKPGVTGCIVCRTLAAIPPTEAEGLRILLRNPGLRYSEISDMIAADEDTPLKLSGDVLGKHANGKCSAKEKLR